MCKLSKRFVVSLTKELEETMDKRASLPLGFLLSERKWNLNESGKLLRTTGTNAFLRYDLPMRN